MLIHLPGLAVPDMQTCIQACADWNIAFYAGGGETDFCWGVLVIKTPGELCHLKSAYVGWNTDLPGRTSDTAIIISD